MAAFQLESKERTEMVFTPRVAHAPPALCLEFESAFPSGRVRQKGKSSMIMESTAVKLLSAAFVVALASVAFADDHGNASATR